MQTPVGSWRHACQRVICTNFRLHRTSIQTYSYLRMVISPNVWHSNNGGHGGKNLRRKGNTTHQCRKIINHNRKNSQQNANQSKNDYNSILHQDCKIPVITVVIYTFQTTLAKPPLIIKSGEEEIIKFNFRTLLLFEDNGTTYVEKHAICMYPFLPAMCNVDATLILQVGEEMIAHYGRDSDDLKEQLTWMRVFLEETTTIAPEEKQKIWEVFKMLGLDKLLDESPWIQQERAKSEAKGEVKGQLKEARASVENIVTVRFPDLIDLARQKVASMKQLEALHALQLQVLTVPNEEAARRLLLPQEPS